MEADLEPTAAPPGLAALVHDGVMDAELAALVWVAIEDGLPVVVGGEPAGDRPAVRDAVVAAAGQCTIVRLQGVQETFAWMPEATELGWQVAAAPGRPRVQAAASPSRPRRRPLLIADFVPPGDASVASPTWGDHARLVIRALTAGYGLAATAGGTRLEDVLGRLAAGPVWAIDDELTQLGIVLLLDPDASGRTRVQVAHYLRPVARDVHAHVQRLPPAVLATWNGRTGTFDHFAWGVIDELAGRTARRPLAFEREQARRAGLLAAASRG